MDGFLRVELYRVLVSIGVGFFSLFLLTFNINIYRAYADRVASEYATSHQSQKASQTMESDNVSNRKTDKTSSEHNKAHQTQNSQSQTNSGPPPSIEWRHVESALKSTMDFFKSYFLVILFLSLIVGEFLSSIGITLIVEFFEKPTDGGIKTRKILVDRDVGWVYFFRLFKAFENRNSFLSVLSEVHFALAKGFAGIFVGTALVSLTNIAMLDLDRFSREGHQTLFSQIELSVLFLLIISPFLLILSMFLAILILDMYEKLRNGMLIGDKKRIFSLLTLAIAFILIAVIIGNPAFLLLAGLAYMLIFIVALFFQITLVGLFIHFASVYILATLILAMPLSILGKFFPSSFSYSIPMAYHLLIIFVTFSSLLLSMINFRFANQMLYLASRRKQKRVGG